MDYGVIMAGGSGTRLWPLSREAMPKQLLRVVGGKSLLRLSFERLLGLLPAERIYVCTLGAHGRAVLDDLPELRPENLIGEPMGRDTANAVGLSAAVLHARDADASFAVVTADHVIEPVDRFCDCLRIGFDSVRRHPGALVTFGIVPSFGHTGLGYVHRGDPLGQGVFAVRAFKEKPDQPTADAYVKSGEYFWNSGMFVWKASTVLERLREYLPKSHEGLTRIARDYDSQYREATLGAVYPTLQKISVDFAIMEPASRRAPGPDAPSGVVTVPMPVQWLDVGSWPQLGETLVRDGAGNATDARKLVMVDSANNIVVSHDEKHLVAALGVRDMVIVHTPDATLIIPKAQAERMKDLVNKVKDVAGAKYV